MPREPKFLTALRAQGAEVRRAGTISGRTRSGRRSGVRYVIWQKGVRGWDAVLYTNRGQSVNVINYGLQHDPTAKDTDVAFATFVAALNTQKE